MQAQGAELRTPTKQRTQETLGFIDTGVTGKQNTLGNIQGTSKK